MYTITTQQYLNKTKNKNKKTMKKISYKAKINSQTLTQYTHNPKSSSHKQKKEESEENIEKNKKT
jgi:hypothetical protein